jgi:hypothetical protein
MTTALSQDCEQEAALKRVALLARAGVERWARFVRPLPLVAVLEEHRVALRLLVAWYERVCVDDGYVCSPPPVGLEALAAIASSDGPSQRDPIATARGAVRVASALVDYRRILEEYRQLIRDGEDVELQLKVSVLCQLDLAAQSVRRFLDSPC